MCRKVGCVVLSYFLLFHAMGSELSLKHQMNVIKSELIKLTNDKTKNTSDYIAYLDSEMQKIDSLQSPYDGDFTEDELKEIKGYLVKVKTVFEQKEIAEEPGFFSTLWGWFVSASPYIVLSASVVAAILFGFSFFGDDEDKGPVEEGETPDEKKPDESAENDKPQDSNGKKPEENPENNKPQDSNGKSPEENPENDKPQDPDGKKPAENPENNKPQDSNGKRPEENSESDKPQDQDGKKPAENPENNKPQDSNGKKPEENPENDKPQDPVESVTKPTEIKLKPRLGDVIIEFTRHGNVVNSVSWCRKCNELYFLSASQDRSVNVFNFSNSYGSHFSLKYKHSDSVYEASWSPKGRYIVSGSDYEEIKIWDVKNNKLVASFDVPHGNPVLTSWGPEGKYIASSEYYFPGLIKIWEVTESADKLKVNAKFVFKSIGGVQDISWSPDEKFIVTANRDKLLHVWSIKKQEYVRQFEGHTRVVESAAWNPHKKYPHIASGSIDKTVRVWDFSTQKNIFTKEHDDYVFAVVWHPSGEYLASASGDGTIKIWDVALKTLVSERQYKGDIRSLGWSPDGKYLTAGFYDGEVRVINILY